MEDKKPPPEWPMEGKVEFQDYSVRYREGLDLVLRSITLNVKGGEKVRWNAQGAGLQHRDAHEGLCRSASWAGRGPGSPP